MSGFAAIDNIEFKSSQLSIMDCATLPEVVRHSVLAKTESCYSIDADLRSKAFNTTGEKIPFA